MLYNLALQMILRLLVILSSLLSLLHCTNNHDGYRYVDSLPKVISIAHLKSLCMGEHYRITNDYIVRGVVVASDWLGELNRSVIIVDESGGLEIAIDIHNIGKHLPIYSEVEVFCNGMMLARVGGKIELGAAPTGDFPIDNIDEILLNRYIRVVGVYEDFAPSTKTFAEISVSDISNIVRFDNISICEEERGLSWCDFENDEAVTTYRTFVDKRGKTFAIRTLATCAYAGEEIPTEEISVIGAIDYSDNRYFLRIVNKWITQ